MTGRDKRNKKSGLGSFIAIAVVLLLSMAESISAEALSWIIVVALIVAAMAGIGFVAGKALKMKNISMGDVKSFRGYTTHESHQPRKYDPEIYRDRDRLRRMEQLDSFLANGLIDKKEYAVLKAHYDKHVENSNNLY